MPARALTLENVPIHKQVFARALLDTGATIRAVANECSIGQSTVIAIKRKTGYGLPFLESVKKQLPTAFYALSGLAMSKVTPEKLDACSAPQLMMVSGIAVDKARDLEGSNRPIFNIVNVVNDCQKTMEKLNSQMGGITSQRALLSQPNA